MPWFAFRTTALALSNFGSRGVTISLGCVIVFFLQAAIEYVLEIGFSFVIQLESTANDRYS